MAGGRPSKYDPKFCEQLIEHMEEGLSYESFAGKIGVARQTLYDWEAAHPEFLDTKRVAFAMSLLWWEQQGCDGLWSIEETSGTGKDQVRTKKTINSSIWIFNMKNRHGWVDKKEIESVNRNITINIDSDDEDL